MFSLNWIRIIIAFALGAIMGLIYGWTIEPVVYTDVTPGILRTDYRADYVLMVAEAYQAEQDVDTAARRLAIITSEPPAQIVLNTLDYARINGFTQSEISLLQGLLSAMQAYQPQSGITP
jgi:hypothetical protein